jgi:hypothetical protein
MPRGDDMDRNSKRGGFFNPKHVKPGPMNPQHIHKQAQLHRNILKYIDVPSALSGLFDKLHI